MDTDKLKKTQITDRKLIVTQTQRATIVLIRLTNGIQLWGERAREREIYLLEANTISDTASSQFYS